MIDRNSARTAQDASVFSTSPRETLDKRPNWLISVAKWIRRPGREEVTLAALAAPGQLRRSLDLLERNPKGEPALAQTLCSISR